MASCDNKYLVSNHVSLKKIEQQHNMECGVTALATIFMHYGFPDLKDLLKEMVNISSKGKMGYDFFSLMKLSEIFNFSADGFQADHEKIDEIPLPAILYYGEDNFVVLTQVNKRSVDIIDMDKGRLSVEKDYFFSVWNGIVLVVQPKENYSSFFVQEQIELNDAPQNRYFSYLLENMNNIKKDAVVFDLTNSHGYIAGELVARGAKKIISVNEQAKPVAVNYLNKKGVLDNVEFLDGDFATLSVKNADYIIFDHKQLFCNPLDNKNDLYRFIIENSDENTIFIPEKISFGYHMDDGKKNIGSLQLPVCLQSLLSYEWMVESDISAMNIEISIETFSRKLNESYSFLIDIPFKKDSICQMHMVPVGNDELIVTMKGAQLLSGKYRLQREVSR